MNHRNKAERPSVYFENCHVTAMTLAVIDVEKEEEHGNPIREVGGRLSIPI